MWDTVSHTLFPVEYCTFQHTFRVLHTQYIYTVHCIRTTYYTLSKIVWHSIPFQTRRDMTCVHIWVLYMYVGCLYISLFQTQELLKTFPSSPAHLLSELLHWAMQRFSVIGSHYTLTQTITRSDTHAKSICSSMKLLSHLPRGNISAQNCSFLAQGTSLKSHLCFFEVLILSQMFLLKSIRGDFKKSEFINCYKLL